ncbi:MAG TPA: biotin--[acetyl-CoA-carboxylase] ligase [Thermoanaerobaculia bacterium]|nr:biotin--[acetyl-CoA-carboxylase] ligase [Thermoanaerobaculia bacterium]
MIDVRAIVSRMKLFESLAWIPRVVSTNDIARRVAAECIENDISLPLAMIFAGEQLHGRGRGERTWSSPAGRGIYATTMYTRKASEFALIPLEIANLIADFLIEVCGVDAAVKWPNDVLVKGKKIAGILIDARMRESEVFLLIGTGINVRSVDSAALIHATSIEETTSLESVDLVQITTAFIEFVDSRLALPFDPAGTLDRWRKLTVHKSGESVTCQIGERNVSGIWEGIDDTGRALIRETSGLVKVSAGDLVVL